MISATGLRAAFLFTCVQSGQGHRRLSERLRVIWTVLVSSAPPTAQQDFEVPRMLNVAQQLRDRKGFSRSTSYRAAVNRIP